MRLVELNLLGVGANQIQINPEHITHFQPVIGQSQTLLWLHGDQMPLTIDEEYIEVASQINEAMDDELVTAIRNGDCEHMENAKALIHEVRRLQWAFGCAALAFVILLLVIIGRAH